MQYSTDTNRLAMKLGMQKEKLDKSIATYNAITAIFPLLESNGIKAGLFGGTALNKIYFGRAQRLSYDIDLHCYSYDKTIDVLSRNGATLKYHGRIKGIVSTKLLFGGIELDLVKASGIQERPRPATLTDLLYYFGVPLIPVRVPSYSLEYLLAEKTVAMAERNELKDIYDTWIGLRLLKNKGKYLRYLKLAVKRRGGKWAIEYVDVGLRIMLKNVAYYEKKQIEVLNQERPASMLKDIAAFMERL